MNDSKQKHLSPLEKAKKLPSPQPGVKVDVPLALLPEYMKLHGLQPGGYIEPDTLMVKRGEEVQ